MRSKSSPAKHAFAERLRKNMTPCEKILWKRLCGKKQGVWFYAQSLAYGYALDFWCPKAGMAVELDDKSHRRRKAYDLKRDLALKKKGILTVRFANAEVKRNPEMVVKKIMAKVRTRLK